MRFQHFLPTRKPFKLLLLMVLSYSGLIYGQPYQQNGVDFGPYQGALSFSGSNNYVDCGDILTQSYTKEAWINIDPDKNGNNNIISGWVGQGEHVFGVPKSEEYKVSAGHNGKWNYVQDKEKLEPGWKHFAVTYDANTKVMKLFRNGKEIDSENNVPPHTNGNRVLIGAYNMKNNINPFIGKIDDVRIWDHARTEDQIKWNLRRFGGQKEGLIAHYDFDSGNPSMNNSTVNILIDKSDKGHHGTLIGFNLNGSRSNWVESIPQHVFKFKKNTLDIKIPYYSNIHVDNNEFIYKGIKRLIIVIHGINRNAISAYTSIDYATDGATTALDHTMIIAPRFMQNEDLNEGEDGESENPKGFTIWDGKGWWSAGSKNSNHDISSFEVIDKLLEQRVRQCPDLKDIIIVGHSAGGQFTQRYMASTKVIETLKTSHPTITVRGIVANPSSYMYLDNKRVKDPNATAGFEFEVPELDSDCNKYNNYRYGLNELWEYLKQAGVKKIKKYHKERRVDYLIGEQDIKRIGDSLDTSCAADKQGINRFNRGQIFQAYLKHLYPGGGDNKHTFYFLPGVGHSTAYVFQSGIGYQLLFNDPLDCKNFELIPEFLIGPCSTDCTKKWQRGLDVMITPGQNLKLGLDPKGLKSVQCTGPDNYSEDGNSWGNLPWIENVQAPNAGVYTIKAQDGKGCWEEVSIKVTVKILEIGKTVSFQSVNYPDMFIRHFDLSGFIQKINETEADQMDATFKVVPALNGKGVNYYSFESVNFPGYYLRHKYLRHKDLKLKLNKNDGSDLFKKDATFIVTSPKYKTIQDRLDNGETPFEIVNDGVDVEELYGKMYEGGLIFYLNTDNGTGMVAATKNQGTFVEWGCNRTIIRGTDRGVGTGEANTTAILKGCAEAGIAARICDQYSVTVDGILYDDWFLPSRDELDLMYVHLHQNGLGGFGNSSYWSSTDIGDLFAWFRYLNSDKEGTSSKEFIRSVRAVRAF